MIDRLLTWCMSLCYKAICGFKLFGNSSLNVHVFVCICICNFILLPEGIYGQKRLVGNANLFKIVFVSSSLAFAHALMGSWVKNYLVHWWANLNTACHISRPPYAGGGWQGERVNHSSWAESVQEVAVALMFVCEGEDPTDPRWRRVWSRLWLMLQDSSALLVLPHSESLETDALPLFMRTTELHANYFMFPWGREKESESKRDINMKIYMKRESSSL